MNEVVSIGPNLIWAVVICVCNRVQNRMQI